MREKRGVEFPGCVCNDVVVIIVCVLMDLGLSAGEEVPPESVTMECYCVLCC